MSDQKEKPATRPKPKKEKEKEPEPEVPSWPPFHFDGSNALKSRLCINLKNCQYDLFRDIAIEELNWRVIDHRGKCIEANPNYKPEEDEEGKKPKLKDRFRVVKDYHQDNWDIFWADSGMTPDFLSSLNCT
jgi:hypothetical protein